VSKSAGALIRQSFSQRGKRLGLATEDTSSSANLQRLEKFRGLEFWIWDKAKHEDRFDRWLTESYTNPIGSRPCCFNHAVGLPVKNNESHPIYLWQQEIFNALQHHKLIAILKARGVGASEFLLRYASWLCLKDDQMRGKNMAVITGIREDLSIELLRRFKNLMPSLEWNMRESVAEVNGCRVIGYPSKRVKDLRGLTDVSFVICDEFAFFDPTDQLQVLPVLEAFQAKSNPTICLLSTPGPLNDVMYNLYQEPADMCRYHRLYIPYEKALGTLISEQEIEQARRQPGFSQEFELRFGSSYTAGTIFPLSDIEYALQLGKRYATDPLLNALAEEQAGYPAIDPLHTELFAIGVDPGWGHSKFGLSMVYLYNDKLHVTVAEEHYQPDEDEMLDKILKLYERTQQPNKTKIFVDASAVPFIRRLKACFPNERTDYEKYQDELRKRGLLTASKDEAEMVHYMKVIPVPFNKYGQKMLASLHAFLQRGDLAIHPKFHTLISALQSARNMPGRTSQFILNKQTQSLDCLDALRLALYNFDVDVPKLEQQEEEEGGEITTSS